MEYSFRCDCPFTSAVDVLGDKWLLVLVKLMLMEGKQTFKDFIESEEAIATNILSTKLKLMEELGVVTKSQLPTNKKTNIYLLTDKGLSLTPLLVELAQWSDTYLRDVHPTLQDGDGLRQIRSDKAAFAAHLMATYRTQRAQLQAQIGH